MSLTPAAHGHPHSLVSKNTVLLCCLSVSSTLAGSSLDALSTHLEKELTALLQETAPHYQERWHHAERDAPLLPIDLNDVEAWLGLESVDPDAIEMFDVPPTTQFGKGGDFRSNPRPVAKKNRLAKVREAFGKGHSFVINSVHQWCPKASRLASALRKKVGLPVDVYMYLTPPYSHSYGLHSDVMDAYMVQLVGSKTWDACDREGKNCTTVDSKHGDVVYLPMGAKHGAWTGRELSAHLTVNVERQFYVWGSIFSAMAKRLLLPKGAQATSKINSMRNFGMEAEHDAEMVTALSHLTTRLPRVMHMPHAVVNFTIYGEELTGGKLEAEFDTFLKEIMTLDFKPKFKLKLGKASRSFKSFSEMVQELGKADRESVQNALAWVTKLIVRSVDEMHRQHSKDRLPEEFSIRDDGKLGALAEKRAKMIEGARTEL